MEIKFNLRHGRNRSSKFLIKVYSVIPVNDFSFFLFLFEVKFEIRIFNPVLAHNYLMSRKLFEQDSM